MAKQIEVALGLHVVEEAPVLLRPVLQIIQHRKYDGEFFLVVLLL